MTSSPPSRPKTSTIAAVSGGGLLLASGGIHLDLYLTGYRHIPTIGWMFLLQVISALLLGLAAIAVAARPVGFSRFKPVAFLAFRCRNS